eukprot:SM000003S11077  [mRNA]  locus=s3:718731:721286:+ [translate_table: standard]
MAALCDLLPAAAAAAADSAGLDPISIASQSFVIKPRPVPILLPPPKSRMRATAAAAAAAAASSHCQPLEQCQAGCSISTLITPRPPCGPQAWVLPHVADEEVPASLRSPHVHEDAARPGRGLQDQAAVLWPIPEEPALAAACNDSVAADSVSWPAVWELPRSGIVGGILANLLKVHVRKQLDYVHRLDVSIGGKSWELLRGRAAHFQLRMLDASFEVHTEQSPRQGAAAAECLVRTLPGVHVECNSGHARHVSGRLLKKPVPIEAFVCVKEEDFNRNLRTSELLKGLLADFWHFRLQTAAADKIQWASTKPLPKLHAEVLDGVVLLKEAPRNQLLTSKVVAAFKVSVGKLDSTLVMTEIEWPPAASTPKTLHGDKQVADGSNVAPSRPLWVASLDLPPGASYVSFKVTTGRLETHVRLNLEL